MRCLGATQGRLVRLFAMEFALLGVAACAVGVAIGFAAQEAIGTALAGLLPVRLTKEMSLFDTTCVTLAPASRRVRCGSGWL